MRVSVLTWMLLAAGCIADDPPDPPLHADCGDKPSDGCTEEECVTDPADPDYASCGGYLYQCIDGDWIDVGHCEFFPLEVEGKWTLSLAVDPDPCPEVAHRRELTLLAARDASGYVVTAEDPAVAIEQAWVEPDIHATTASVVIVDDWGTTEAARVTIDVTFDWFDAIGGTASATVDGCAYAFTVSGTLARP